MEPVDGNRQSGILSIINRDKIDRINTDRPYASENTMAAAAVISPAPYSHPPPPYSRDSRGWSSHSISGLISPPDSRRTSDNEKSIPPPIQTSQPHRQSLPSIHEALGNGPKPNPYASPVSASLPPASHQLPYPQPPPPASRPYPPEHAPYQPHLAPAQPRQPSPPLPVHQQPHPYSRPEERGGGYVEAPRQPSMTTMPPAPAPLHPYAAPHYEPARYEHDLRAREGGPSHYHHPPPQQAPYHYPPGQQPLPPAPPTLGYDHHRYPPRDPREVTDPWKLSREGEKQDPAAAARQGVKRHLDVWDFENNLAEINTASTALQEWSAHYNNIAQEQQRSTATLPARMPTMEAVEEMLKHQYRIGAALQRMQGIIQEQVTIDQRMREQGNRSGEYEDEMSMYGDDMKNHGYTSEGKKRRGRAAPPGRCHSCNRAETPEWRRGPDGARTLCNACGLHYAKLTRKNTAKQPQGSNGSSLRPKSMDDVSPRPL